MINKYRKSLMNTHKESQRMKEMKITIKKDKHQFKTALGCSLNRKHLPKIMPIIVPPANSWF